MTEIVTNNDHIDVLHKIINNAEKFVIFACPFWYTQEHPEEAVFSVFDHDIEQALSRGVDILFICNQDFIERLQTYYRSLYIKYNKKIKVYSLDDFYTYSYSTNLNFHGKIYINECDSLITSQNITGLSRSLDIGVYTDEPELYLEVVAWLGELLCRGEFYKQLQFENMMKGTLFGDYIQWYRNQQ
jgi:hypothetical protein